MRIAPAIAPLLLVAGCSFGSEGAFTGPRALDTCDLEIPICNTTAGCKLVEEDRFLEGVFPGQRAIIVPTAGEATIRVEVYWRSQLGPGADTEIIWHEPACVDAFRFESQGANIFDDSNAQGIFVKQQQVFREGEHLVEIRSDATAEYLIRTSVLTNSEVDAEETPGLF